MIRDILKVAGEPVAWLEIGEDDIGRPEPVAVHLNEPNIAAHRKAPLYSDHRLLAMYAAGAADMKERCIFVCEGATAYTQFQTVEHYKIAAFISTVISALPIAAEQAPCDSTQTNTKGEPHG